MTAQELTPRERIRHHIRELLLNYVEWSKGAEFFRPFLYMDRKGIYFCHNTIYNMIPRGLLIELRNYGIDLAGFADKKDKIDKAELYLTHEDDKYVYAGMFYFWRLPKAEAVKR